MESSDKSVMIRIGEERSFDLSLVFVSNYSIIPDMGFYLKQPIPQSPHTIVNTTVKNIIDENTLLCDIGLANDVMVNLGIEIENIRIGDKFQFGGEFKAETFPETLLKF